MAKRKATKRAGKKLGVYKQDGSAAARALQLLGKRAGRAKRKASTQPELTCEQLTVLGRHAILKAAEELNRLVRCINVQRLEFVAGDESREVLKSAHATALSGLKLLALAHERESANA